MTALALLPIQPAVLPQLENSVADAALFEGLFSTCLGICLDEPLPVDQQLEQQTEDPSTELLNPAMVVAADPSILPVLLLRPFGHFVQRAQSEHVATSSEPALSAPLGRTSTVEGNTLPQVKAAQSNVAFTVDVLDAQAQPEFHTAAEPPGISSGVPIPALAPTAGPAMSVDLPAAYTEVPATEIHQPESSPALDRALAISEIPKPAEPPQLAVRLDPVMLESGEPTQRVEVLVEQRGAALHFSVNSDDPSLAADMRASLGELADALTDQGFHAKTWHPVEAVRATVEADMTGPDHEAGDPRRDGGHQAGGGRQDQNQQRGDEGRSMPDWIAELESSLFAPKVLNRSFA